MFLQSYPNAHIRIANKYPFFDVTLTTRVLTKESHDGHVTLVGQGPTAGTEKKKYKYIPGIGV